MKVKAFIDTNTFIFGFEFRASNSAQVLGLINEGKIEAFINLRVVIEVSNYFKRHHSALEANSFVKYLLESCTIVYENDFEEEKKKLKGKIKEKDLEQIAATKALGLKFIVAFDRDFNPFPEYKTPKQFLKELELKTSGTEF
ncbi:MAG: PIN domain-containing protein [Candidatus Diapherotrites archaeon]|nr:PIN domain-containing protein [Candidatus Diapherotrites archaeon]